MKHQSRDQEEEFHTERSAISQADVEWYRMITLCLKGETDMFGLEDIMGAGTYGRVSKIILQPDLNARQWFQIAREYAYTFSSIWKHLLRISYELLIYFYMPRT